MTGAEAIMTMIIYKIFIVMGIFDKIFFGVVTRSCIGKTKLGLGMGMILGNQWRMKSLTIAV